MNWLVLIILVTGMACGTTTTRADTLHQSALMGSAGQYGGTAINGYQYVGSRFYLQESSIVTRVGGHMGSPAQAFTYFAAIVRLDGPTALPQGSPFLPEEVVAVTNFSMGVSGWPSTNLMVPLRANVAPGWYGLVFGGGYYSQPLFGAYGDGIMPANNTNLPGTSYFGWTGPYLQQSNTWQDGICSGVLFVVEGNAVTSFPRVSSMRFAGNQVVITLTNLLWGFQTSVETMDGSNTANWTALTNCEFVATSCWGNCTTTVSNMQKAIWIRTIQQ